MLRDKLQELVQSIEERLDVLESFDIAKTEYENGLNQAETNTLWRIRYMLKNIIDGKDD